MRGIYTPGQFELRNPQNPEQELKADTETDMIQGVKKGEPVLIY
jgi:hypothetical protein